MVGNGLAGAWCLAAHWRTELRTRGVWWLTVFAQVAMFVQVGLGVGMVAGQDIKAPELHMLYGFLALFTIAILYAYRQQLRDWVYLLYGFGGLFVMGLGIRAFLLDR